MIRRNHLAVSLKSTGLSFSGKQATPVKKGQKRPLVSTSGSSSTSPEDNRPLKPSNPRSRITAKTVSVPARPQLPSIMSSSTPVRPKSSLLHQRISWSRMPQVSNLFLSLRILLRRWTLRRHHLRRGNLPLEVTISIKSKTHSPDYKDANISCPGLILISSDDESSIPKMQEFSNSNLATSGLSNRDAPEFTSDPDGNISSASNSSRTSSRRKKQTAFYGSPIRHVVNLVNSSIPSSSVPISPDRKVRFAQEIQEVDFQAEHSRVRSPRAAEGFSRKFTRFYLTTRRITR